MLSGNHGGLVDLYLLSLETGRARAADARCVRRSRADVHARRAVDRLRHRAVQRRTSRRSSPGRCGSRACDLADRERRRRSRAFLQGQADQPAGLGRRPHGDVHRRAGRRQQSLPHADRRRADSADLVVRDRRRRHHAVQPGAQSASTSGRLAFSVFEDDGHAIYVLDPARRRRARSRARRTGEAAAAARADGRAPATCSGILADFGRGLPASGPSPPSVPYQHKLTLDAIGQPTISAGISQFGGFVGGSMSAYFSDMLGDRALGVSAQVAGDLSDFGGAVVYINRRHRWNWAAVLEDTPYRGGLPHRGRGSERQSRDVHRSDRAADRPRRLWHRRRFRSARRTRRVLRRRRTLSFTRETRTATYAADTLRVSGRHDDTPAVAGRRCIWRTRRSLSCTTRRIFGATSPILGRRYRVQVGQSMGSLNYTTRARRLAPVLHAEAAGHVRLRAVHYRPIWRRRGRAAAGRALCGVSRARARLRPGSISPSECRFVVGAFQCPRVRQSGRQPDARRQRRSAGAAGRSVPRRSAVRSAADRSRGVRGCGRHLDQSTRPAFAGGTRELLRSVGGAARINVFGLLVLEIAASRPLDRIDKSWQWQIGIREGF